MLVKLMLSHQQVISLKFPGIAKWSDAIFPPPGHDGQLKQLSKTDTVTIGEKLKKENNKLNRAVHCVPDTISKVKIELDLNATINTK